jgi:polysaccharide biosynthesis/export protein
MKLSTNPTLNAKAAVFSLILVFLLAGCDWGKSSSKDSVIKPGVDAATTNEPTLGADVLRPGDRIRVVYNDIPDRVEPAELQVPEGDGTLTLYLGVKANFAGKKVPQLEREIESIYVDEKKLFRRITVNIERLGQTVSVGGEVREAGNVPWVAGMTVTSAINAAKGMTDYAAKWRVLTRSTKVVTTVDVVKAQQDPTLDLKVYPGDKIEVPRRGLGAFGL